LAEVYGNTLCMGHYKLTLLITRLHSNFTPLRQVSVLISIRLHRRHACGQISDKQFPHYKILTNMASLLSVV